MKNQNTCIALLALLALAPSGVTVVNGQPASRDPIVITPPAVPNGSNWSRAPFPAARRRDDVHRPDGEAIDRNLPPNTPATDPEPHPLPEPTVAVLQPSPAAGGVAAAEPALMPTGRPTVGLATSLEPVPTTAAIQAGTFAARDQLAADIESRIKAAETSLKSMRGSAREMNAEARSQFRAAEEEIRQAERALRSSLRSARRAGEAEWEAARTKLASDFQAYAAALQRLDAAAGLPAR